MSGSLSNQMTTKAELVARVNRTLQFSNTCHDPDSGEFCELGHSKHGDRGGPGENQKKYEGSVTIPSKSSWVGSLTDKQKTALKNDKLPIVKMGDKFLAPPPATDHAAYRAAQLGIGEMLQKKAGSDKSILETIVETKTGDYHEDPRPGKDPRYDYTLGDLPIKVGVVIDRNGHVPTIIATHQALDREARRKVNASRGRGGKPDPQVSKDAANDKRAKSLELVNDWRVAHKLQPIELIEP